MCLCPCSRRKEWSREASNEAHEPSYWMSWCRLSIRSCASNSIRHLVAPHSLACLTPEIAFGCPLDLSMVRASIAVVLAFRAVGDPSAMLPDFEYGDHLRPILEAPPVAASYMRPSLGRWGGIALWGARVGTRSIATTAQAAHCRAMATLTPAYASTSCTSMTSDTRIMSGWHGCGRDGRRAVRSRSCARLRAISTPCRPRYPPRRGCSEPSFGIWCGRAHALDALE